MRVYKAILSLGLVVMFILTVNDAAMANGGEFKETRYRGENPDG